MIVDWILLTLRIIAPLLLYLFLSITIYQWIKYSQKQQIPSAFLWRLDQPTIRHQLDKVASFGRDHDNSIVVDSEYVSARHATLTYRQGQWWVTDLNSTNGTTLNGSVLQTPTPIAYGDVITLGGVQFCLEQGGDAVG